MAVLEHKLFLFIFLIRFLGTGSSLFGPRNPEVLALISIKVALEDPRGALNNWDEFSVDPCSWAMVTCSSENLVISLGAPSQSLSGTLSPAIGNLTNLRQVLLQNNNISGEIPPEIGALSELQTLDLSNNRFSGVVPYTLGLLSDLHYLKLNNNTLIGEIPSSLSKIPELAFLDLSYNDLRGPVPKFRAKTFSISGNPRICGMSSYGGCFRPASSPLVSGNPRSNRIIIALGIGFSFMFIFPMFFILGFIFFRRKSQTVLNISDQQEQGLIQLGNLKTFTIRELQLATDNFHPRNILGTGGFGNVYKGKLSDGTIVAVKRLKDLAGAAGEAQFRTELGMISLAAHRNLLRLIGYCATPTERLLVYPYMSNGSVDSRLRVKPTLNWSTRKMIAIGAARGLLYLHEECDPKIIHRDVKAANVLLDDYYEAIVGDFGLAKVIDHDESHVTTAVRGTVGHIAPEYLSTGQSSEKTDVFGFGILILELVTGLRALHFGKNVKQKGAVVDWVRKIQEEKRVEVLVDRELGGEYDVMEVAEMLQVAVLCTQCLPANRPKMVEVVQMLEGDGLVLKWAASRGLCNHITRFSHSHRDDGFPMGGCDSGHGGEESDLTCMLGAMTDLEDEDDDDETLQSFAIELSGPR